MPHSERGGEAVTRRRPEVRVWRADLRTGHRKPTLGESRLPREGVRAEVLCLVAFCAARGSETATGGARSVGLTLRARRQPPDQTLRSSEPPGWVLGGAGPRAPFWAFCGITWEGFLGAGTELKRFS